MNILLLLLIPALLGMYAQMRLSSAYEKYRAVRSRNNITGRDAARAVLMAAGINDVEIVPVGGQLTDHYDPSKKRLALSADIYGGTSIAAIGVAAHEAGHAVQHKQNYAPLNLRMALVPITNFACQLLPIVMLGGFLFFNSIMAVYIGIAIYLVLTLFQLITLPVEFDASSRAKRYLVSLGIVEPSETEGVSAVLNAAAFTYVAAFVTSLLWLIHLISIANDRR